MKKLTFSKRYDILNQYKNSMSESEYTNLWINKYESIMLVDLKKILRKKKLKRIIEDQNHIMM